MDTTTAASPPVQAWELLADLAASGHASATIADADALAKRIAELTRGRLACPWGLLLLQADVHIPRALASWGLDDERTQRLIVRNGHGLPADAVEWRPGDRAHVRWEPERAHVVVEPAS